jgi:two-component system nitrogen regulation response regulator GlnG
METFAGQASMKNQNLHDQALKLFEKPLIEKILEKTGGNQIQAAKVLGINRNTLRKKMRELEIDV